MRKGNGRNGEVRLDQKLSRLGSIVPGKSDGAAAVFHCSQGGIGWPDHVLFYDNKGKLVGALDTANIGKSPGRQQVSKVVIGAKGVQVTVDAVPLTGDNELWGTSIASVFYAWNPGKSQMRQQRAVISTPDSQAKMFVQALQRRSESAAKRLAPRVNVRQALPSAGVKVRFERCIGTYSDGRVFGNIDAGSLMELGQRGCLLSYSSSDGRSALSMAVFQRSGFTWNVVDFVGIAS